MTIFLCGQKVITYALPLRDILPRDEITFAEDPNPFTVQAISDSGRWIVCTRQWTTWDIEQAHIEGDNEFYDISGWPDLGDCVYTVIDTTRWVRGPDNAVSSLGYETADDCKEALALFERGDFTHSTRNPPILCQIIAQRWER